MKPLLNVYEEAKRRLAEGVREQGKDHIDTVFHNGRFYRISVERLREPEEIEAAIRDLTEEASQ